MITYEFRVRRDDFQDTLARESFLSEPDLNIVEDLRMSRVRFVQNVLESEVSRAQSVTEMLSENPSTVCQMTSELGAYSQLLEQLTSIYGLLDSVTT